jgi:glycerophosphoryl diester phosphodiesterase
MPPNPSHLSYVELKRPTIFAHRGSSKYAPENTITAFKLAIEQRADAIELDAKLSSDGQVVVIHDQTVDRTTNGTGRVDRLTWEELQSLDSGSKFHVSFQCEKIPSLVDVFETIGNQIFINIELKNYSSPSDDLPTRVIGLVRKYALQQSVLLSSFNPFALLVAHHLVPDVPLGLLTMRGRKGAVSRGWLGRLIPHQALHPAWKDVDLKLISNNHQHGYRVHPYTVNEPMVMQDLFGKGVDGIYTDDPPLARQVAAEIFASQLADSTSA